MALQKLQNKKQKKNHKSHEEGIKAPNVPKNEYRELDFKQR